MFNPGSANCNGSQFMITYPRVEPEVLDGSHVAFGQVTEGWNVLMALEQLGDARQEGLTFQRITLEQCGVLRYGKDGVGGRRRRGGGVRVRGGVRFRGEVWEGTARGEGVGECREEGFFRGEVRVGGCARARRQVRVRVSIARA